MEREHQMRIIPARAGFTARIATTPSTRRDHPRSRGVYRPNRDNAFHTAGSSPLARGLHEQYILPEAGRRIIPARAGFTRRSRPWRCRCGDHPRSRGVYAFWAAVERHARGSSPLARGLHGEEMYDYGPDRIIPARAGFTICER